MPKDKLQITFRPRSVVERRQFLYLLGTELNFWDTLETIREVRDSSVQVDQELAEILIRANVLEYGGSQRAMRGAVEGEKFDELLGAMEEREAQLDAAAEDD